MIGRTLWPGGRARPGLACLVVAFLVAGCSFILDPKIDQCQSNQDCKRFREDSVCDEHHICVVSPAIESVADAGCGPDATAGRVLFISSCTRAICIPFDNAQRLTRFSADGTLAPLPVRP